MKARLAEADKEQARLLDDKNDASLAGAIDELAGALVRKDLATLHREAMKTPTPEYEEIVKSLREINGGMPRPPSMPRGGFRTAAGSDRRRGVSVAARRRP